MMEFAGLFVFWKMVATGVVSILLWSAVTFAVFMVGLWVREKVKRLRRYK